MVAVQPSLLDLGDRPAAGSLEAGVERTELGAGAWVDRRIGWMTGAGPLTERLLAGVDWQAERRRMYDRVVDVPRLQRFYGEGEALPDPALEAARSVLDRHYAGEMGEPFRTVGLCLYRDGSDSVAWHGDRIGRGRREDTLVAILSLGAPRVFALRPKGSGHSRRWVLGPGDLLVMGGSCQRTCDHAIPKTARAVGPRISVQFRPRDVR